MSAKLVSQDRNAVWYGEGGIRTPVELPQT